MMQFLLLLLLAAVAWYAYSNLSQRAKPDGGVKHCMTCGMDGVPNSQTKGHIVIEIVLWLCFLLPGLLYSIWRLSTRAEVCSHCSGSTLVPMDSPAAQMHRKQLTG